MEIKDVLVGNTPAKRLYRGDTLLWERPSGQYTITKHVGSIVETQTVSGGDNRGLITFPLQERKMFVGWYRQSNFNASSLVDFSDVTEDMTVYGRYVTYDEIYFDVTRTENLIGNVPFNYTIRFKAPVPVVINFKVWRRDTEDDLTPTSDYYERGTFETDGTTIKVNIGTKKNPIYAYKRVGIANITNQGLYSGFKVKLFWTTPDGASVEDGAEYEFGYSLGTVKNITLIN